MLSLFAMENKLVNNEGVKENGVNKINYIFQFKSKLKS